MMRRQLPDIRPLAGGLLNRVAAGVVLLLLAMSVLLVYTLYRGRLQAFREAELASRSNSHVLGQTVTNLLEKIDHTLVMTSEESLRRHNGSGHDKAMQQYLEHQFHRIPELSSLRIADVHGMVRLSSGLRPATTLSIADRDYFVYLRDHPDEGMVLSRPIIGKIKGEWMIVCARRINLPGDRFGGVVFATLPLQQFHNLFEQASLGKSGSVSLRFADLALIVYFTAAQKQEQEHASHNIGSAKVSPVWRRMLAQGETAEGNYLTECMIDGIRRTFAYRRLQPYPLYLNVGLSVDDYLLQWRKELVLTCIALGLGWGGVLLLVRQLNHHRRQTELELLVEERTSALLDTSRKLAKNEERLQALLDISDHRAEDIQGLLDYTLEKVIQITGSTIGYIYHYHEDRREFVLNTWSKGVMPSCSVLNPQTVYQLEKTGIWGEAVRQRKAILINDYSAFDPLKKGYPEGHIPLSRFLTIPVFDIHEKIVAVVGVANKELPYSDQDVQQLGLMMAEVWRIASRLELEMKLVHAAQEWQSTFDAISDSVSLLDRDHRILRCNRASTQLFKRDLSEIVGRHCWELVHGSDQPLEDSPMQRALKSRTTESRLVFADGRWLHVTVDPLLNDQGEVTGAVHIVHDDTERVADEQALRGMQAQVIQQEKMASIGQLSAGVAHEINNPMGFINSNLGTLEKYVDKFDRYITLLEELLQQSGNDAHLQAAAGLRKELKLEYVLRDVRHLLAESVEGAGRVMKIVRDLKTFAHTDTKQLTRADINQCIDSAVTIVINEIKYVAELDLHYGELPKVLCNVQQINQVLVNLLVNAAHAIADLGREEQGRIIVRTWADAESCYISVSDTGGGIAEENRTRIFDPFFTTKEVGKGTGLGLWISYEIIDKHGGEITLLSEPGKGSTFAVRLPVAGPPQQEDSNGQDTDSR